MQGKNDAQRGRRSSPVVVRGWRQLDLLLSLGSLRSMALILEGDTGGHVQARRAHVCTAAQPSAGHMEQGGKPAEGAAAWTQEAHHK